MTWHQIPGKDYAVISQTPDLQKQKNNARADCKAREKAPDDRPVHRGDLTIFL